MGDQVNHTCTNRRTLFGWWIATDDGMLERLGDSRSLADAFRENVACSLWATAHGGEVANHGSGTTRFVSRGLLVLVKIRFVAAATTFFGGGVCGRFFASEHHGDGNWRVGWLDVGWHFVSPSGLVVVRARGRDNVLATELDATGKLARRATIEPNRRCYPEAGVLHGESLQATPRGRHR